MNYSWVPVPAKRIARNVLPTRLLRRGRVKVRRRKVPLKKRIEVDVFDGTLRIGGALRAGAGEVHSLTLRSRSTGHVSEYALANPGSKFFFAVSLRDIISEFESLPGALDLSLMWTRAPITDEASSEDSGPVAMRLGNFAKTYRPERAMRDEVDGTSLTLDISKYGNLALVLGDVAPDRLSISTIKASLGEQRFDLRAIVTVGDRDIRSGSLVVRGRNTDHCVKMPVAIERAPRRSLSRCGNIVYVVTGTYDLAEVMKSIPESEETLDFSVSLASGDGLERERRLKAPSNVIKGRDAGTVLIRGNVTDSLVPYATFRVHNLSFRRQTFETASYRLMMRLAKVWPLFSIARLFTNVWLIGEVPYKAQDNGFQLFRYIRTEHPRRKAYYVIAADAPDFNKVDALGNAVRHGSIRHVWLSFLASRIASTHHAEYLMPSREWRVVRGIRGVRVFLQHGPTAAKNVTRVYGRKTSQERPTERFLVTSDLEKRIVIEDYGYRAHQVHVTGFARFDALFHDVPTPNRTIVVMPTWRDNLMNLEAFLASEYYANWHGFLSSDALRALLEKHDLDIALLLHPNMRKYSTHFDIPHVRQYELGEVDVQEMMRKSQALITDFSSVAWDFSYLDRPVFFYQFEKPVLGGPRAPHIDYVSSLPGTISTDPESLILELESAVSGDFTVDEEFVARSRAFLKFKDENNRERVYQAVKKAWNLRVFGARIANHQLSQEFWRRYRASVWYIRSMAVLMAVARALPVTDDIVFESDRGRSYGDSPRYIYEQLMMDGYHGRIFWANNTTQRFVATNTVKLRRASPAYWWYISRARLVVTNQNMPAVFKPNRGTFYLQTWHGTPLKKMQHDVPVMQGRDDGYQEKAARLTSRWSALVSPSPYATRAFTSAFQFRRPIFETGYPRNDLFHWEDRDRRAANTRFRLGIANEHRKILLYAPTFRDDARTGLHWSHSSAVDFERFVEALGDDWVLLVRFHPLVRAKLPASVIQSSAVIDVSGYPDIQELLLISDVLATDYSSLFFDYASLDRPIIFYAYDLEHYRDDLRGFYLDYESTVPGSIVRDQGELQKVLSEVASGTDSSIERRRTFADVFTALDDGLASARVLQELRDIKALNRS